MEALRIEDRPALRNPYLLLTFAGWSDAAGVATATGRFLTEHLQAERFASIDPEEFYSFADQRPQARYNASGQREVIWPANEFFACPQPTLERDLIIGVGIEPHLKWRTFTNLVLSFVKEFNVYQTFTLGALWADVLYSMPIQFSGSATDPQLAARLGLGTGSRYEGPTGMVGVLHDTLRRNYLTSASIWANMPYYVSVTPNPKGILSLARRGMDVIGLSTTFTELESEARDFDARVAEAIAQDPKIAEHVRKLERQLSPGRRSTRPSTPLPQEDPVSGDELAAEFERFLREQRRDPDER